MLKKRKFEESPSGKKQDGANEKKRRLITAVYAIFFGTLSGVIVTFALSVFIPQFFTEWAGSLVCPGKIEFVRLKQTYVCYTAPNDYFELGDALFWAIFKRLIIPAIAAGFLLALGFVKLGEYLWQRRDAAGFN